MLRIGHSYDLHRLSENRKLILGNVEIPHHVGLIGHSDADVLLHAVTESIIGAMGMGDIGTLFPDTDDKYKNIDSSILLKDVIIIMENNKYEINNIDTIIYAQQPHLNKYMPAIKSRLAELLKIDQSLVNVKATTGERVGIIGREEAIAAESIVLLRKAEEK